MLQQGEINFARRPFFFYIWTPSAAPPLKKTLQRCPSRNRSPQFGVGRRGSPRFVPLCSDLGSLCAGFVPICSELLRFLPISSDLCSELIRTNQGNPLLLTPFASPRQKLREVRDAFCAVRLRPTQSEAATLGGSGRGWWEEEAFDGKTGLCNMALIASLGCHCVKTSAPFPMNPARICHMSLSHWLPRFFRSRKRTPKQKIARTAPKNFLNNSRALPNKTRVLRTFVAKLLKFFGVPFLSLSYVSPSCCSGKLWRRPSSKLPAIQDFIR